MNKTGIENIERVVLAVSDIKASIEFFSDILGTKFEEMPTGAQAQERVVVSPLGLELIQPLSDESAIAKIIKRKGEGVFSIVLKVTDLDKTAAEFAKKGLHKINEVKVGSMREAFFHPKDTRGVAFVLTEYENRHPSAIAASGG